MTPGVVSQIETFGGAGRAASHFAISALNIGVAFVEGPFPWGPLNRARTGGHRPSEGSLANRTLADRASRHQR